MKIFRDEEDIIDIKHAFERVIDKVNNEKQALKEERKKLGDEIEKDEDAVGIIQNKQERFEQVTYNLEAFIKVSRIIEDELFKYDLELEFEDWEVE